MVNDPRDQTAYRLAIALLGIALVVAIGGVCWVAAEHQCVKNIAPGLWIALGAIGGVFVGALLPLSLRSAQLQNTVTLTCLGAVAVGAVVFAAMQATNLPLDALGATVGGLLIGLPIPAPGRGDP